MLISTKSAHLVFSRRQVVFAGNRLVVVVGVVVSISQHVEANEYRQR